jgi:glycosyltransferase involved in cell wall biosynthesis
MRVASAQPLISAVCITANRPRFVDLAIECFMEQTWENKELVIYDSGEDRVKAQDLPGVRYVRGVARTIGELRNAAVEHSKGRIVAHWDDDDYSHPRRLEEQADLILSSDCEIVGYSTMVFHDTTKKEWWLYKGDLANQAYALGTSLMYWRSTWEKRRFPILNQAEDNAFLFRRNLITAYGHRPVRMIARHHHACTTPVSGKFIAHPRAITNWTQITAPGDIKGLKALLK